jgi:hypothetical protein
MPQKWVIAREREKVFQAAFKSLPAGMGSKPMDVAVFAEDYVSIEPSLAPRAQC